MKKTKILLVAAFAAVLASCGGGKSGGKPNFGDNEYAVRTVQGQDAALQTTYPATISSSSSSTTSLTLPLYVRRRHR